MRTHTTAYGAEAVAKLGELVAAAKGGDPLAPVTILVRDDVAAITVRRALAAGIGARRGVAAINVTTLRRLAEQLLAASGQTVPPVTSVLLTALWRRELADEPGCFAPVVEHGATVRALVRAHGELRQLEDEHLDVIACTSQLVGDLVRLHRCVAARALAGRRDATAVLESATALLRHRPAAHSASLGPVILHLPDDLAAKELQLVEALDAACVLTALVGLTGEPDVDGPLLEAFRASAEAGQAGSAPRESLAHRVMHASDSDDEARAIVREVRALLADGVAAHRIAVVHPVAVPYARLLHDHFAACGIATNGAGVRPLRDHAIADGFLALLALDPDDLRRGAFFDWLGRVPVRLGDGPATVPRTRWERLSREAGVTGGDWAERLADHEARHQARLDADRDNPDASERSLAYRERSIAESQHLGAFVDELRHRLQEGRALTGWAALGEWARATFRRYIGTLESMDRLPEGEQRAATAIDGVLGAVVELDGIGDAPRLRELVEILEVDLDARKPRVGRFGEGVFVGPISAAPSLDVQHVFVLGLSEDLYPGRQRIDPLLSESVRISTDGGLPTTRDRLRREQRALLAAFAAGSHVVASFPRGDLRRGAERLPSRWLMPTLRALTERPELTATRWAEASGADLRSIASHWEGVARADRPGSEQEWRLRHLTGGGALADDALYTAVELIHARRAEAFTRFDGNLESVAGLPDYADGTALISPTALERFAGCPHAFFVERLLNVKPLETPEEIITIRPWDLGSMVHEVMDRLTTEAELLPGYGERWSAADRERMREIMAEVMADYERRGLTGHPRLWDRERERLHQDLEAILDLDDEAHHTRDSRVVASELSFGMRGHTPVRIELGSGAIAMRGSADRVDETRGGTLIVTDFKTGSSGGFTDIHDDPVVAGKKLQLPLYAHAARAAFGNDTVEAGYWFIGRRDRGKRVDVRLDANLEKIYREALETLVTAIREGRFIARPPASDDFSWVQCAFCNPDGVGYGHVRGSSERKRTDAALAGLFSLLDPSVLPATSPSGETSE